MEIKQTIYVKSATINVLFVKILLHSATNVTQVSIQMEMHVSQNALLENMDITTIKGATIVTIIVQNVLKQAPGNVQSVSGISS